MLILAAQTLIIMEIVNLINVLPWHPERRWSIREPSKINKIIIHQELAEGSVESVNQYHIRPNHISPRGCPHFCYHYGIRENGQTIQANDLTNIVWHTGGANETSVGIMLEGNFKGPGHELGREKPSDEQMKSLETLVARLIEMLSLAPQDVFGHYHFGKPACPGYFVSEWIENLRNRIPSVDDATEMSLKTLQTRLNKLGYDCGKVDGILGRKTAEAIRKFQKDMNLVVDGIPGPQTFGKLFTLT